MTTEEEKKKNQQTKETGQTGGETGGETAGYSSQWESQLDDLLEKYQNRGDFSYDPDADALYQRYKDQYIRQGKLAMEDTMGQAASLTGGYGNSYALTAGQQTYNQYLEGLNDRIPELYQMAMNQYTRQGDALMDQYSLLLDRENRDYSRYQDQAELAKYQVEGMLSLGVVPSQELISQSGLTGEYIAALLAGYRSGGGSGGGSSSRGGSGRRGGSGSGGEDGAPGSGPGIDTTRNLNGLKGSAWDYTLHNLDRLLASGDTKTANTYMSQVKDQMNQQQYIQAANTWSKYGKKWKKS